MDVLVKVSGSLVRDDKFYEWLLSTINPYDDLFILCGGGDQTTEVLEENGIPYKFGPRGREIESLEGKRLANQVLQKERIYIERRLGKEKVFATTLVPVLKIGNKVFHMNADNYALALYPSFGKTYIVTLKGRDKSSLPELERLEVVYL